MNGNSIFQNLVLTLNKIILFPIVLQNHLFPFFFFFHSLSKRTVKESEPDDNINNANIEKDSLCFDK